MDQVDKATQPGSMAIMRSRDPLIVRISGGPSSRPAAAPEPVAANSAKYMTPAAPRSRLSHPTADGFVWSDHPMKNLQRL
jgi:hypothetical protein